MDTMKRLLETRTKMILDLRFYARISMMLKLELNDDIDTARTDGLSIQFNPKFADSLSDNELKAVIAHESMHVAHLHNFRRCGRDQKRWNVVCDYSINGEIKKAGLDLPANALYDPKFNGMSPEKIYGQFHEDCESPENGQPNPFSKAGEVADCPSDGQGEGEGEGEGQNIAPEQLSAGQQNRMDEIKTAVMTQAALDAKCGHETGAGSSAVKAMQSKIDWRKELEEFFQSTVQDDFSWTRPDRRFLNSYYGDPALILPSIESEGMQAMAFILDTSASVSEPILDQFWSETVKAAKESKCEVYVFQVDSSLCDVQVYSHDDLPAKLDIHGRGGTRFDPAFDYIEEHGIELDCAIYLTDMEANPPKSNPDFPVLWASSESYEKHGCDGWPQWFKDENYNHSRIIEVFAY